MYIGANQDLRKIVITNLNDITEILLQYHSSPMGGHSGINGTLAKRSQYYMWYGMKEEVLRMPQYQSNLSIT